MALAIKDPDACVDFSVDWGADYCDGQLLVDSAWRVVPDEPGGLEVIGASHDLLSATARVRGGRAGSVYRLTNSVTLSDGQVDDRTIAIRVDAQ